MNNCLFIYNFYTINKYKVAARCKHWILCFFPLMFCTICHFACEFGWQILWQIQIIILSEVPFSIHMADISLNGSIDTEVCWFCLFKGSVGLCPFFLLMNSDKAVQKTSTQAYFTLLFFWFIHCPSEHYKTLVVLLQTVYGWRKKMKELLRPDVNC